MTVTEEIEFNIRRAYDRLNAHDIEGFLEIWDDEAVFTFPGTSILGGTHRGKAALYRFFWMLHQVMVGLRFEPKNIAIGQEWLALEWEDHGMTITGENFDNNGVTLARLKDGKIIEARDYVDTQKLKGFIMGSRRAVS